MPPSTSFMGSQSAQGLLPSPKCRPNLLMRQHCPPINPLQLSETIPRVPVLIEEVAHVPAGMTLLALPFG